MNRETKLNRSKRQRIQAEKHGNAAKDVVYEGSETIHKQAADKTASHLREGNYYTQTKNHVAGAKKGPGKVYYKTEPIHKVNSRNAKPASFMFNLMQTLKRFFGFGVAKA